MNLLFCRNDGLGAFGGAGHADTFFDSSGRRPATRDAAKTS